jgi:hypothetical protein
MSNILYIFNYESVFEMPQAKALLVDKRDPSKALLKIPAEFATLFKQGFFRSHGLEINYNGHQAWLSRDILTQVLRKKPKIKLADIGLSFREFHMDSAVQSKADAFAQICARVKFDMESENHIMVISTQPITNEHAEFAKYLQHYLNQYLSTADVKVFIHVVSVAGRSLTTKVGDDITVKAVAVAEQVIGFKIRKNKVTPIEYDRRYDKVNYFDNDDDYVQAIVNLKMILSSLKFDDPELKAEVINEHLPKCAVWSHYVTSNEVNPLMSIQVKL